MFVLKMIAPIPPLPSNGCRICNRSEVPVLNKLRKAGAQYSSQAFIGISDPFCSMASINLCVS